MARKRYKPDEIVAKLRQVDVLVSQGQNRVDAIRQIGVSEVTCYRWRHEFGGLKIEQVKRDIIELARQHGRYGYRKVAELLRQAGWIINDKRVERIWRREGLKVPPKQPKRTEAFDRRDKRARRAEQDRLRPRPLSSLEPSYPSITP